MPVPVRRPLTITLVRHIFRAYVGIVIVATGVQLAVAYRDNGLAAQHELHALASALEPDVRQALSNSGESALQALANLTLESEAVGSVRLGDVPDTLHVQATRRHDDGEPARPDVRRVFALAGGSGSPQRLGYIDFTVNQPDVMSRTYRAAVWLLTGALIQAACLWLIVVLLVRRMLARPLDELVRRVEGAGPAGDETHFIVQADTALELSRLQEAIGSMAAHARQARKLEAEKLTAETRSAEQSRFLANASHDLRQPLHALSLYLGALARNDMSASASTLVGKALQCSQVVESMFRSILDLSRLDAGMAQVQVAAFPLQRILAAVQIQFEPQARSKGIALRVVGTRFTAMSDEALVSRVVHNLVSNAVRYTTQGGVLVGCRRVGQFVRIEVHDTGPGIADTARRAIFGEYVRGTPAADTAPVSERGAGLGLAIAQRLSIVLGHALALRSKPGRGTVASLQVPMTIAAAGQTPPDPGGPVTPGPEAAHPLAGKMVLIVDDEPSILDASSVLIESWGGIPVTASSHEEAVALVETPDFIPDAVLCDFQLSGEASGHSLIGHIRRTLGHPVPALLVTGARLPELDHALSAHVLYKPVAEETLRMALIAVLCRGHLQTGDTDPEGTAP